MSLPEPYYHRDGITIYCADCRDVLPYLPPVDLVFFDPPYGINVAEWDKEFNTQDVAALAMTMLVETGSLYATCSSHILEPMMACIPYRRIISWGKPNLPMRKHLNEWEWSTEFILWATKSDEFIFTKPDGESGRDYWRIPVENGFLNPDNNPHPARKPLALLKRIVNSSSPISGLILDPFMGSGTTLRAAMDLGRKAIGIEIEERYCEIAVKRLQQSVMRLEVPA